MPLTGNVADFPFKNNVPDPLLSGKELPTFKFALEKSAGKVDGGSFGKEATVAQLPISKGIAGVSMRLEPGVTRELHWHATAAEWAFVLEGRVRTTVVDPAGGAEINDFDPGDLWYFPRGHAHSLACLGEEPCHFILIFDNGYFSEFGTFSITDWLGHASKELLAKNFGQPVATFEGIPTKEAYFVHGRVPPADALPLQGALTSPPSTHKYRLLAQEPHSIHKFGREWRVGANRFPISETMTGVVLDLNAGGLRELHWHPNADEWQYVRQRRLQRHVVRFAWPLPHGDAEQGRRRLHSAGLWSFDREYRRQAGTHLDRPEYRKLSGDRSVAMDGWHAELRARRSLRQIR
jgi:oxalate decarboxylase